MKTYASVVSAEALPDFHVQVVFDTGERGVFDCKHLLSDPFWHRLSDPAFFRLVRAAYGTLVWPDDIDIAPEDVWEGTIKDSTTVSSDRYPEIEVQPLFVAESGAVYDKPKKSPPPPSP